MRDSQQCSRMECKKLKRDDWIELGLKSYLLQGNKGARNNDVYPMHDCCESSDLVSVTSEAICNTTP